MTDPAPALPPWVQPYEPDFRELLRQLDLVPGFIFQPIVLPSPDLARALADWLATQDVAVRVFDMRHDPWDELGTQLRTLTFDPAAERRAVVVITPSHFDRTAARDGLAAFNFSRDSIAENLHCPLLWCGDVHLLRTTAELASDFWSIAATVYRIPLRALSDVPAGPMRIFWSGAAQESLESIVCRFEQVRQHGDARTLAQTGLDLAEAQLVSGDRSEALRTLASIKTIIQTDAPALELPRRVLEHATDAPNLSDAIDSMRTRIDAARARGAIVVEARLHQQLAEFYVRAKRSSDALQSRLTARARYLEAGDDTSAMAVESELFQSFDRLSPALLEEMREHAEHIVQGAFTPDARVRGWSFLADLAVHRQRWDDADDAANAMMRELNPDSPDWLRALLTRQQVALGRRDMTACIDRSTELCEYASLHRALPVTCLGLHARGAARLELSDYRGASRDLLAALELGAKLGLHDLEAQVTHLLALATRPLGVPEVFTAFLARSFEAKLRAGLPLSSDTAELARESLDHKLVDLVLSLSDEPSRRKLAVTQLHALADASERALQKRGVDLRNVDTWPLPPLSQSQVAPEP
ncbi:hypothetical protein OV090_31580 [Nannocystis sp. RBIL2]|uniref:hypothetical protein n=1 Tax=Nannocystis sp. RBIL2 TaxID=2996788 RepID=UPI00226DFAEA|nr:hypothetical protein [Nannocystis sp. RBIL2]MCY1069325.1 hypothetical protein [Nannocystis sp. RBIL2]